MTETGGPALTPEEIIARAFNLDMKRQWDGAPLPGPSNDVTSWHATGGSIELDEIASAAISALTAAGYAIRPMEPTEEMIDAGHAASKTLAPVVAIYRAMLRAGGHVDE